MPDPARDPADVHGEEPVTLVPWDATWPVQFEQERRRLEATLRPWLTGPIEHIGSTAIAGIAAKPVIDIMAGVDTLDGSIGARDAAAALGYTYFPYRPDVMHWFCKPSPQRRTHHLHLVPTGSALWHERLQFRDHLRATPAAAAAYEALKRDLAGRHRFDREAYTEGKTTFVRSILDAVGA
jgi:GrpB-like predicted nucleotidyltransferase (UPF0157 family)